MKDYLNLILSGNDLSRDDAKKVMTGIMSGKYENSQIAGFLVAIRMKGETVDEIVGFAEAMRAHMTPVPITVPAVDMCGTGGDSSGTFNISTAASFVVAGAGVPVAKHGNRAISSRSGSADVLTALGININQPAAVMGKCVDEIGLGFLFAPALHPAMKHAMPARQSLAVRTVFNILGPLCNPAGVRRQVIGVFARELTDKLARVLKTLGSEKAIVVHGLDGLDEFSLCADTQLTTINFSGEVKTSLSKPEDFGLVPTSLENLAGGSPEENAAKIEDILNGKSGPQRDIVVLNAAAGIAVANGELDMLQAVPLAEHSIESGSALKVLEELRKIK